MNNKNINNVSLEQQISELSFTGLFIWAFVGLFSSLFTAVAVELSNIFPILIFHVPLFFVLKYSSPSVGFFYATKPINISFFALVSYR